MGKLYIPAGYLLGLFCAAVAAFPALAVAGTVSVDVSPTTGYSVTNRSTVALPPRTTSGPVQTYNPTLGPLAGGGAYQTTSSGVTITAIKDGGTASTTMSGRINAGAAAMRNGLARCLTSFRCNVALAGGAAGVQALLDGIDWVLDEGGRPQQRSQNPPPVFGGDEVSNTAAPYWGCEPNDPRQISLGLTRESWPYCQDQGYKQTFYCFPDYPPNRPEYKLIGVAGGRCAYKSMSDVYPPAFDPSYSYSNPSDSDISSNVDNNYTPDPSDLPYLSSGGLDFSGPGVDFEIMDIPSITGAGSPSFIENSDGTSKGTYSEFEFTWTGPSKQPQVNVDETTTETTYGPSGDIISTTITNNNSSGSPANNEIEIPTDCDFMPTVCRFIDWFTEPDPEINNEPDFTQLIDTIDIEREFTVGSSTASCPAPFQISLAWVPSVEVSLQPFCDLADLLRPFLLSLCFLYSGMIILRT